MISLIVCSRCPDKLDSLKKNVAKTIGTEYEFVIIDNSNNRYTIFSAYNEGVARSKGDILCFMHEDLVFRSKKWGNKVIAHLDNNEIGLIGVIGGTYLPKVPLITWWDCGMSGHIIQGITIEKHYYRLIPIHKIKERKERKEKTSEVVAVDGLWFCIKKSMFETIRFDDKTFHGFHCYDLDICMQVLDQNKKIEVVFDILIEHKSAGCKDNNFYDTLLEWYKKWEHCLPKTCINTPQKYLSHDMTLSDYYIARCEDRDIQHEKRIKADPRIWLMNRKIVRKLLYYLLTHS